MAMSVEELRQSLIDLGFDPSSLKGVGKSELRKMLEDSQSVKETLDNVVVDESPKLPITTPEDDVDNRPLMTDAKWTDYVMDLFDERELDKGMPKADSLRRVAELLLGPFNTFTRVEQVPTIDNAGRATVVVDIQFINGLKQSFSGAADVFSGNTAKEFAVHAVATAETRAEGRALRKALRLTKILTAEELQGADVDEANGTDKRIVSSMLNSLNVMCDRAGVDLIRLAIKLGFDIQTPEDLTHKQGLDISNQLSKYQRKLEEIPVEVKK
jgi:hypothetical protein